MSTTRLAQTGNNIWTFWAL